MGLIAFRPQLAGFEGRRLLWTPFRQSNEKWPVDFADLAQPRSAGHRDEGTGCGACPREAASVHANRAQRRRQSSVGRHDGATGSMLARGKIRNRHTERKLGRFYANGGAAVSDLTPFGAVFE